MIAADSANSGTDTLFQSNDTSLGVPLTGRDENLAKSLSEINELQIKNRELIAEIEKMRVQMASDEISQRIIMEKNRVIIAEFG